MEAFSMHHFHLHLNVWALLVAALLQFALGALWYSLFFVKPWMALTGHVKGQRPESFAPAMASSVISALIVPFVLAHIVLWSGAHEAGAGAFVGFLCWVGFIAVPLFAEAIYEPRPYKLFAINSGYWLITLLISGILLAVWQ
jgi:hypothetical protein